MKRYVQISLSGCLSLPHGVVCIHFCNILYQYMLYAIPSVNVILGIMDCYKFKNSYKNYIKSLRYILSYLISTYRNINEIV